MSQQSGTSSSAAAVRGLLLVVVAAAIGWLLLMAGSDSESVATDTTASASTDTTLAPATTSIPDEGAPDTTLAATDETTNIDDSATGGDNSIDGFQPRPPAEVSVQVANSTAVRGAAGRVTDRLKVLGFVTLTPTDLRGTPLDRSRVYYLPGSLLEAQNIAEVLELDRQNDVFAMFEDTSAIAVYEMPDVFVALGTDIAR